MSEDEFDITKSLALNADSDSDDSGSDAESYGDVQDEILSDSDSESQPKVKRPKLDPQSFPKLELSDDEDAKDPDNLTTYFADNNPQVKKAKNGSFQSFGLSRFLLANIARKGFKQPTPIQRKTIPLIMHNRDVVGMARTGSGKTAAFVLPMIEKLKTHSAKVGARAVILSPSRELATQTYKQVKEFSAKTDLRSIVLIGGDSMEDQFSAMTSNPDIVIATPGRFMHLKIEMDLDLRSVEYIVFDEADRLFELGFAEQLNELLASLPTSRQTLLFSATLPRSLVDFAKAGLSNPTLVRLDAESKISDQLQMAFFTTKRSEREANLLHILQETIKMPTATPEQLKRLQDTEKRNAESSDEEEEQNDDGKKSKKRKFKKERLPPANIIPSEHSTIVFVPTKHHVEYITQLLRESGYLVSYIYGSLDQRARAAQLYQFRLGLTTILVVTDVAARGIDIPVLANVVNFTLPGASKIFIHRVGRTARAGNKGWAYSIVNEKELPYLLDLELFLGKKVLLTSMYQKKCELLKERMGAAYKPPVLSYTDRLVLGSVPRAELEECQEVYEAILKNNYDLRVVKDVAAKGEKLFYRTRQSASAESVKRSKEILQGGSWDEQHILFGPNAEKEKEAFLNKLNNRYSKETVFEFNKKGNDKAEDSMVEFMQKRRRQLAGVQRKAKQRRELLETERALGLAHGIENEILNEKDEVGYNVRPVSDVQEEELNEIFEDGESVLEKKYEKRRKSYRDSQFFLSHYAPAADIQDKQLEINQSFANSAAHAAFDLENDDKTQVNKQIYRWDTKKGNYVNSQSTDKKYIISESGQRIPATFKSGKFEEWKKAHGNVSRDDSGELKKLGRKFQHKKVAAPKLPDKYRDDYHTQKKKVESAVESGRRVKGYNKPGQQQELKSAEEIRKQRKLKEKRRSKNGRPSKRK